MKSTRAMIAVLAGLVFLTAALGATLSLEPDSAIQERIAAVVTAVVDDPGATQERVDALRSEAAGRRQVLLLQLALFLSDSSSTEESMVGGMLLQGLEFTQDEKLEAVIPHLEAEDASLRRVLAEILGTVDRPEGGAPDFRVYDPWIEQHEREPSEALIRYMYEVSPGSALAGMRRVFGEQQPSARSDAALRHLEVLVAKHQGLEPWSDDERASAGETLTRLAQDPSWWVRMYAAVTLQKQPVLVTPSLQERLAGDGDALVRSVAP